MDTGHIDSHEDLGINAPVSERVTYRKVTTCAPLHTKGHAEMVNGSTTDGELPGDTIWHYFYGPVEGTNTLTANWTYAYNTVSIALKCIQHITLTEIARNS